MLRYLGEYFYHYACTEYAWYRLTEVQWDPSKSSSKQQRLRNVILSDFLVMTIM